MGQVVEEVEALYGWEGDGDAEGAVGVIAIVVFGTISILCLGDDDG